jgi:hypothetical protein
MLLHEEVRVYYQMSDTTVRLARGGVEKKKLIYGIGYPGSGKSTAFKSALSEWTYQEITKPFPAVLYENGWILLGQWRNGLNPGTDALEYNVKPKVLEWLKLHSPGLVIAEGIRLLNRAFFSACKAMGYSIHIVLFDVSRECSQARFVERGSEWDKKKESWFKGTSTQVDNMKDMATKVIDASQSPQQVAQELRLFIEEQSSLISNLWGDWTEEQRKSVLADEGAQADEAGRKLAVGEKGKGKGKKAKAKPAEATPSKKLKQMHGSANENEAAAPKSSDESSMAAAAWAKGLSKEELMRSAVQSIRDAPAHAQLVVTKKGENLLTFRQSLCPWGDACECHALCTHAHWEYQLFESTAADHVAAALRHVKLLSKGCAECGGIEGLSLDLEAVQETYYCKPCWRAWT